MARLLLAAVLSLFVGVGVVMASTTVTGTARSGQPFTVAFTTESVGIVSVTATWDPSPKVRYVLTVKHLRDAADPFSYDLICQVYEPLDGSGSGQTPGNYTCSFDDAPTGAWTAEFKPLSGKVNVTLAISTP